MFSVYNSQAFFLFCFLFLHFLSLYTLSLSTEYCLSFHQLTKWSWYQQLGIQILGTHCNEKKAAQEEEKKNLFLFQFLF